MSDAWPIMSQRPELAPGEIHVWHASLDRPASQLQELGAHLDAEEKARANRFYFDRDRNRYIVGRGMLRVLIGRYLQRPPAQIRFAYGEHGKPELAAAHQSDLQFNLSHAQGQALFAFCRRAIIGVDIEQIRPLDDAEQIAERFFSAAENERFHTVSAAQKPQAFFNCWTRKEAYIKAIGEGLSCPLHLFDVSLRPQEPARLLRVRGSETLAREWSLYNLTPVAGFVGAVVVRGSDWRLQCWRWSDAVTT